MIKKVLFFLIPFFLVACGGDEPSSNVSKLNGYWAITHIQIIEHIGGNHNTTDNEVPPHGLDSYAGEINYRYDVLIFDEDFVTVRGDMPSCPKREDYDDSLDGELIYNIDLENWRNSIGSYTDQDACPVGSYRINSNDLIIGSLNMGRLTFTSDDTFTLDYKKSIGVSGDYRRSIYTYTRIYSLTL